VEEQAEVVRWTLIRWEVAEASVVVVLAVAQLADVRSMHVLL
jgi:hypothetical protein